MGNSQILQYEQQTQDFIVLRRAYNVNRSVQKTGERSEQKAHGVSLQYCSHAEDVQWGRLQILYHNVVYKSILYIGYLTLNKEMLDKCY